MSIAYLKHLLEVETKRTEAAVVDAVVVAEEAIANKTTIAEVFQEAAKTSAKGTVKSAITVAPEMLNKAKVLADDLSKLVVSTGSLNSFITGFLEAHPAVNKEVQAEYEKLRSNFVLEVESKGADIAAKYACKLDLLNKAKDSIKASPDYKKALNIEKEFLGQQGASRAAAVVRAYIGVPLAEVFARAILKITELKLEALSSLVAKVGRRSVKMNQADVMKVLTKLVTTHQKAQKDPEVEKMAQVLSDVKKSASKLLSTSTSTKVRKAVTSRYSFSKSDRDIVNRFSSAFVFDLADLKRVWYNDYLIYLTNEPIDSATSERLKTGLAGLADVAIDIARYLAIQELTKWTAAGNLGAILPGTKGMVFCFVNGKPAKNVSNKFADKRALTLKLYNYNSSSHVITYDNAYENLVEWSRTEQPWDIVKDIVTKLNMYFNNIKALNASGKAPKDESDISSLELDRVTPEHLTVMLDGAAPTVRTAKDKLRHNPYAYNLFRDRGRVKNTNIIVPTDKSNSMRVEIPIYNIGANKDVGFAFGYVKKVLLAKTSSWFDPGHVNSVKLSSTMGDVALGAFTYVVGDLTNKSDSAPVQARIKHVTDTMDLIYKDLTDTNVEGELAELFLKNGLFEGVLKDAIKADVHKKLAKEFLTGYIEFSRNMRGGKQHDVSFVTNLVAGISKELHLEPGDSKEKLEDIFPLTFQVFMDMAKTATGVRVENAAINQWFGNVLQKKLDEAKTIYLTHIRSKLASKLADLREKGGSADEIAKLEGSPSILQILEEAIRKSLHGEAIKNVSIKSSASEKRKLKIKAAPVLIPKVSYTVKKKPPSKAVKVKVGNVSVPLPKSASKGGSSGSSKISQALKAVTSKVKKGLGSLGSLISRATSGITNRAKPKQSVLNIKNLLNQMLPDYMEQNMRAPALRWDTGRFGNSVRATDVQITEEATEIKYTYMKYPYQTFEPGFRQGSIDRDPRKVIEKSIREIAKVLVLTNLRVERV